MSQRTTDRNSSNRSVPLDLKRGRSSGQTPPSLDGVVDCLRRRAHAKSRSVVSPIPPAAGHKASSETRVDHGGAARRPRAVTPGRFPDPRGDRGPCPPSGSAPGGRLFLQPVRRLFSRLSVLLCASLDADGTSGLGLFCRRETKRGFRPRSRGPKDTARTRDDLHRDRSVSVRRGPIPDYATRSRGLAAGTVAGFYPLSSSVDGARPRPVLAI